MDDRVHHEPRKFGDGRAEERDLDARRDVDVERVVPEPPVVLLVVLPVRDRHRNAVRQVRHDAEHAVRPRTLVPVLRSQRTRSTVILTVLYVVIFMVQAKRTDNETETVWRCRCKTHRQVVPNLVDRATRTRTQYISE